MPVATKKQLEDLLEALMPILAQLEELEKNYGDILREYRQERGIVTQEDRTDAAIKMIQKYSNL